MKWYSWLRPHFDQLITGYHAGRGHHALLIQALPGMGDTALVYAITRFLMCWQPQEYKSCGKCRACQLMQAGVHPDYHTLASEKGQTALGIDEVRKVSKKLYDRARLGGAKVVWVTNAALLTESAASALLKILEEPPEQTWFFLFCREPGRMLATLRSRCSIYRLAVPQESWALAWLEREVTTSQEKMLTALRLCSGAPAAALALLEPTMCLQREHFCASLKVAVENCDWLSLLAVLNQNQAPERLHWLISLLLDAQKIQHGITLINNIDSLALVNMLAYHLSKAALLVILHDICDCRKQLLTVTGIDHELLLTDQLLRIEYYLQPNGAPPPPVSFF